jgi:hypothetical protein
MTRDHDDSGGGLAALAGSGVLLMYVGALVPGFLACLFLALALAVPLLLPAIALLLLYGLFAGLRKLVRAVTAGRGRHTRLRAQQSEALELVVEHAPHARAGS